MTNKSLREFSAFLFSTTALFFAGLLFSEAHAASFNCAKSKTFVEGAICLDATLSRLDEEMASAYKQVLRSSDNPDLAMRSQRDWRNFIRNRCKDASCLQNAYEQRIGQLNGGNILGWMDSISYSAALRGQPGQTQISYAPASEDLIPYKKWLQESAIIDASLRLAMSQIFVPNTFKALGAQCNETNAYYSHSTDTVVICYELVRALAGQYNVGAGQSQSNEQVETRRFFAGLQYVILHEMGHAILHRLGAEPTLGGQETEADNFATVLLLKKWASTQETNDALWGVWSFYKSAAKPAYSDIEYADSHEVPQQRFSNFSCNLAGYSPNYTKSLISANFLSSARAKNCPYEWKRNLAAISKLPKPR